MKSPTIKRVRFSTSKTTVYSECYVSNEKHTATKTTKSKGVVVEKVSDDTPPEIVFSKKDEETTEEQNVEVMVCDDHPVITQPSQLTITDIPSHTEKDIEFLNMLDSHPDSESKRYFKQIWFEYKTKGHRQEGLIEIGDERIEFEFGDDIQWWKA